MPKNVAVSQAIAERNATIKALLQEVDHDGTKRYRQVDLADMFGLTQGAISQIVRNPHSAEYWEWVSDI